MNPVYLAPGDTFAERYRILRCLARGGMGAVYEVLHIETDRRRALKVMLPEIVTSREFRERFQLEARVTANVQSEFIVDVFDAGVDEGTGMPFLVMELLEGEELGHLVERRGPLEPSAVVTYLRQAAAALDKTHARSIVHRDLKPGNLFLTLRDDGSPRIKILDFGISKIVSTTAGGSTDTCGVGTPLYMAPEQVAGEKITLATDIYSFGLIAYTLLVGTAYWQEESDRLDNMLAVALQTATGPVESALVRARRHGRSLPAAFDEWFARATRRKPSERFARASQAATALAAVFGIAIPDATPTHNVHPHTPALGALETPAAGLHGSTAPGAELDGASAPKRSGARSWIAGVSAAAVLGAIGVAFVATRPNVEPSLKSAASASLSDATQPSAGASGRRLDETAPNSTASAIPSASPPIANPASSAATPLAHPRQKHLATPAGVRGGATAPANASATGPSPEANGVPKAKKYTRD